MSQHIDDTMQRTRPSGAASGMDPPSAACEFDRAMQRRHAQALNALSPPTLSRLRATRHAAASPARSRQGLGWILAGGSAAVLALAIAVQLQRSPVDVAAPVQVATIAPDSALEPTIASDDDYRSLVAGLDENPDLYLWLATNHDTLTLPMER